MATAQNIIDAATLNLGLRAQGITFSTYDSSANTDAFTVLQDLIAELAADNKVHIPTPSATSDTLDLYDEQVRSLKLLLTRDLMVPFRVFEISPQLQRLIDMAEDNLQADNNISIELDMSELCWGSGHYNINTDG